MMNNGHEPVRDLGELINKPTKVAWQINGPMVRHADPEGYTPLVDGKLPRDSYATAEDLVEMMRPVIRKEIREALREAGLSLGGD